MELFVNIVSGGMPSTIFAESSIVGLWDWRSEYDSGISKVTCNLKVKISFYAKVQGKVTPTQRWRKANTARKRTVSCKSMWKMVRLKSWDNCHEMFQKIAVLKFLGKHALWRPLLPMCAACSLERYWRLTPSQIFSCGLFEISGNSNATR